MLSHTKTNKQNFPKVQKKCWKNHVSTQDNIFSLFIKKFEATHWFETASLKKGHTHPQQATAYKNARQILSKFSKSTPMNCHG